MPFALYFCAIMLSAHTFAYSGEIAVACPAEVSGVASSGSAPWQPFRSKVGHPDLAGLASGELSAISLYSGHPRDEASLAPHDDRAVTADLRESTWTLDGETWVGCFYGGSSVQLVRALPATVTSCRMLEGVKPGSVKVSRFVCGER